MLILSTSRCVLIAFKAFLLLQPIPLPPQIRLMTDFNDFRAEELSNSGVKAAYDALDPTFRTEALILVNFYR